MLYEKCEAYQAACDAFKAKYENCESELSVAEAKLAKYATLRFWGRLLGKSTVCPAVVLVFRAKEMLDGVSVSRSFLLGYICFRPILTHFVGLFKFQLHRFP